MVATMRWRLAVCVVLVAGVFATYCATVAQAIRNTPSWANIE